MSPGRFISLLLYGFVCALLGGVAYRRGVVELVRPLATEGEHNHDLGLGRECRVCRERSDAIAELVRRLGLRGQPLELVHRAQHERRP